MQNLVLVIPLPLHCARRPASLQCHAGGPDCCPEDCPRPPAQSQRQSCGTRHTKQICNKHIPTFVGPEVTRTQRANEVDHFGQAFHRKRTNHTNICSHKSQDEIHLLHCHCVP